MLFVFVLLCGSQFTGKVVAVHDGDTVRVLVEDIATHAKREVKVRLNEIDAPELKQPFGSRSKQALSGKVFGKVVTVEDHGKDRYERTLGTIFLEGENVNAWMVREGMVWQYKRYSKSKELASLEMEAREARRGLWAEREPVPPWDWRKESAAKSRASKR